MIFSARAPFVSFDLFPVFPTPGRAAPRPPTHAPIEFLRVLSTHSIHNISDICRECALSHHRLKSCCVQVASLEIEGGHEKLQVLQCLSAEDFPRLGDFSSQIENDSGIAWLILFITTCLSNSRDDQCISLALHLLQD
jgi:hypothetical protein